MVVWFILPVPGHPRKNEEIVNWLLEEYDFDLLPVEHINGMIAGIDLPETARMYPHHFKGEGQFVAHLQFKGENPAPKYKASKSNLSREQSGLVAGICTKTFAGQSKGESCRLLVTNSISCQNFCQI